MPALPLSTIRQPYRYQGWLTVVPEPVVMTGTLSATPSFPALALAYSVVSGTHSAIEEGMEVVVTSSGGALKGRLRVAPGTVTSTSLPVNEFGAGRLNAAAGDTITVLRSWRVRDRLVAANASFDRDSRVTYTTQNETIAPVANAGGPWAGWLGAGLSYALVSLSALESYTVDPDSAGTVTYLWDVVDGTITIGSTTTSDIQVRFPVGTRWVKLTVTDTTNGQTAIKRIPVVVHSTASPPHEVVVTELSGTRRDGWSASFELPAGADTSSIPDGSLVIYHEDEYYGGGAAVSYGNFAGRSSRVKFVGYVTEDSIEIDYETNTVSFSAINPKALLNELPGFSQVLTQVADPATWLEYQSGLSVARAIIYLLRWGTTYLDLFDVIRPNTDRAYPAFYLQQKTPLAQIQELADGNDCEITCDRTGRLMVSQHLALVNSTWRNAATTIATLTSDDRVRLRATRTHRFSVAQLEARGFTIAGAPVFSRAPSAPAEAPTFTTQERLIATSQTDLNERAGRRFARENRLYNQTPAPTLELELPGGYDCLDFYPEWLAVTVASSGNKRGLALTAARTIIERITVEHDVTNGSKRVLVTIQHETDGPAGITYVPPSTNVPETTPVSYVPIANENNWGLNPFPLWTGANQLPVTVFALSSTSAKAARGTGIAGGSITWTDISTGLSGYSTWGASDPYQYRRMYALTTNGLYKTDDKLAAAPVWNLLASNDSMFGDSNRFGHMMVMSHNKKGWLMVASDSYVSVSFDYGSSWTVVGLRQTTANTWATLTPTAEDYPLIPMTAARLAIGMHNNSTLGEMWAVIGDSSGFEVRAPTLMKSTDYGLTWSVALQEIGTGDITGGGALVVPYRRDATAKNLPEDGHTVIWRGGTYDAPNGQSFHSSVTRSGGSESFDTTLGSPPTGYVFQNGVGSVLSPDGFDDKAGHWRSQHVFTGSGNVQAAIIQDNAFLYGSGEVALALSTDGGATWTASTGLTGFGGAPSMNGFSMHDSFYIVWCGWMDYLSFRTHWLYGDIGYYGGGGYLKITTDNGTTWFGSPPAFFTDGGVAYAEADLSAFQ